MNLLNVLSDPSYAAQSVAFTGTAGTVAGWAPGPQGVLIWADSPFYYIVGEGVTATATNGTPLPANTPIIAEVPLTITGKWTVSAIQIAAGGILYCKPINKQ